MNSPLPHFRDVIPAKAEIHLIILEERSFVDGAIDPSLRWDDVARGRVQGDERRRG